MEFFLIFIIIVLAILLFVFFALLVIQPLPAIGANKPEPEIIIKEPCRK